VWRTQFAVSLARATDFVMLCFERMGDVLLFGILRVVMLRELAGGVVSMLCLMQPGDRFAHVLVVRFGIGPGFCADQQAITAAYGTVPVRAQFEPFATFLLAPDAAQDAGDIAQAEAGILVIAL
jgi:hypothetical protein